MQEAMRTGAPGQRTSSSVGFAARPPGPRASCPWRTDKTLVNKVRCQKMNRNDILLAMTHWDSIYETAIDNYGLITTAQAAEQGVNPAELLRWVKMGRLTKRGHGVFRLTRYLPTDYDYYAEALALVGDGAAIFGESVLAMQNLAFVNPPKIAVATSARIRKKLPDWIRLVPHVDVANPSCYQGISCQSTADAILQCRATVPVERLEAAVIDARRQGLITGKEERLLKKEFAK